MRTERFTRLLEDYIDASELQRRGTPRISILPNRLRAFDRRAFQGQRVRADAPLTGNEASGISSTELTSKTLDEIAYMVRGFREKKRGRLTLDTPKLLERDVEAQWNIKPRGCAA
jgi:hypothetical protein